MPPPLLRRLSLEEMDLAAAVHRAAFDARLPWLAGLHTPDQDRAYFRDHLFPACEVWGAHAGSRLTGILAFRAAWIDQLYVLPDEQGRGVGTALLNLAKTRDDVLNLWTFQRNAGARRFYERHGFAAIELTDGSGNDEREPDVLYRWSLHGP